METNRSIFQVIWHYLSPVSQRRIRMVCKSLHNWSTEWKRNVPNIKELTNHKNWKSWFVEARHISGRDEIHYHWMWLDECVSVQVTFVQVNETILLESIRIQYEISNHNDYSHASISANKNNWHDFSVIGGKKPASLPQNKYSAVFKEMRSLITNWKTNRKVEKRLFPYCSCVFRYGYVPEVTWIEQKRMYMCDKCKNN